MTPINSTTNTDSSIQKAQDAVEVNLAKFESALAHLADRVEHTSHRVEHVGELARKSRDELMHLKDVATSAIDPFIPVLKQGKDMSNKAIVEVKENPKPYLWAFAGLIGAFLAYRSFQGNRASTRIEGRSYAKQNLYNNSFDTTGAPI
jgi:hypothetical protein